VSAHREDGAKTYTFPFIWFSVITSAVEKGHDVPGQRRVEEGREEEKHEEEAAAETRAQHAAERKEVKEQQGREAGEPQVVHRYIGVAQMDIHRFREPYRLPVDEKAEETATGQKEERCSLHGNN